MARFLKNLEDGRASVLREGNDGGFGGETRHKLVQEFAVAYYNGSLRPNMAEKDPVTGKDIEFLMDMPQFDRTKKSEVWSSSNAVGSGYQYSVVYRDKRFSDLEQLLQIYLGAVQAPDGDVSGVERRLYDMILVLLREGRVPKTFKIQSPREEREERFAVMLDDFAKSLDELGKRVRQLEEQVGAQKAQSARQEAPPPQDAVS